MMYLSDSYIIKDDEPMLELKVRVININPQQKHEVLEKCPVLKDYSIFIDTIRKYQGQKVDGAYEQAINECRGHSIDKGILADYLRVHGSEVINMLMSEYDYELDIEVQREEAFEEGRKLAQERFASLTAKLVEAGRSEDVIKAAQDVELCKKLYQEYNIQ